MLISDEELDIITYKDVFSGIDHRRIVEYINTRQQWVPVYDINYDSRPGDHIILPENAFGDIVDVPPPTGWVAHLEDSYLQDRFTGVVQELMDEFLNRSPMEGWWQIIRTKINRTEPMDRPLRRYEGSHVDTEDPERDIFSAVYYPEDCDGDLVIFSHGHTPGRGPQGGLDRERIMDQQLPQEVLRFTPKANTMVIFNGRLFHRAEHPRQRSTRYAINTVWQYTARQQFWDEFPVYHKSSTPKYSWS